MKKKDAVLKFTSLYDATYDDAIAYTLGRTGSVEILTNVLKDTYEKLYKKLLKSKRYNFDEIKSCFFSFLNEAISHHNSNNDSNNVAVLDVDSDNINEILDTELNISEDTAKELLLHKKIQSYITTRDESERKVFYMFFYCDYSVSQISKLLSLDEIYTKKLLCCILNKIKSNFLEEYISQ